MTCHLMRWGSRKNRSNDRVQGWNQDCGVSKIEGNFSISVVFKWPLPRETLFFEFSKTVIQRTDTNSLKQNYSSLKQNYRLAPPERSRRISVRAATPLSPRFFVCSLTLEIGMRMWVCGAATQKSRTFLCGSCRQTLLLQTVKLQVRGLI